MKKKMNYGAKFFLFALILVPLVGSRWNISVAASINNNFESSSDTLLTIYTYESLLADPEYDFIDAYANYSGISKDSIQIEYLEDANTIVSRAVLEKENPVADVIIGIDNVLIHTAKSQQILAPYESPTLSNISTDLVQYLDSDFYVLPYDYGIIALYYNTMNINSTSNPELKELTLQDILDYDLDKQLIVENPTLSSPGLGFLLWTIAVFGDPSIGFEGLLNQDWRDWWNKASSDIRITPSWGAAFTEWYEEGSNRSMMVSYGTSPAYSACLYNDPSQKAIVSHEKNQENAWLQIEGLGLVKDAPHEDQAKDFIDWFLSDELQNNIAEHNWMYPANSNVNVSSTFADAVISPADVTILNDLITPKMLNDNLESWKVGWEELIVAKSVPGYSSGFFMIASLIGIGMSTIFKKRT
ncbi:hypothetical protein NEF87_001519 [Candidatus Lokiarchaeum ossiferum]|uniref:Thiamine ABC transporter substrate-binding protein n=1 Tax=Candidatus Lokiarchaeum ossiferum TaxID=2951803 RepID=A0ABY6HNZ5_9ARCH|nr:hypothetical protein NEF87_001519 [Candidatus Lokiarchaeum sp. B-35]